MPATHPTDACFNKILLFGFTKHLIKIFGCKLYMPEICANFVAVMPKCFEIHFALPP